MTKNTAKNIMIELKGFIKKEVIDLSFNIHYDLVDETPKDTGWAAANWVPSIGSPFTGEVGDFSSYGTSDIQKQGELFLLTWDMSKGSIYLANNVEYIQALNAGHSQQAPAMFVEKAIERGLRDALKKRGERIATRRGW